MPRPRRRSGPSRAARTTTRTELIDRLAERSGLTKVVVQDLVVALLDEIVGELARDRRVEFREFGVFDVCVRRARQGRNPRTGEAVPVPARRVVVFRGGSELRDRVERPVETTDKED